MGWTPTDSQVGGPWAGLRADGPCPQPQFGRNTELGPALGDQSWETEEGRKTWLSGLHFRENTEIWSLPLVSSIGDQKMETSAPLTCGSGSPPLLQAEPPPRIPPVTAPLRGPAWQDTGIPKWDRQKGRGIPLRDARLEAGRAMPSAAGNGRPGQ